MNGETDTPPIVVALAGQPNVGKSTVFNMLTGLNQHVGNWPGKTVEQKIGEFTFHGRRFRVVDLPGTYSLTANSEEERIARDYLIYERPDVVVVIVNAAALERNLYLVAELLALPVRLVIGLNMVDVAAQQGIHVEPHVLEAALGVPVIPLVASKNQGLRELLSAIEHVATAEGAFTPRRPVVRSEHLPVLQEIESIVAGHVPSPYPESWFALKLLEGDVEIAERLHEADPQVWEKVQAVLKQHEDAYVDIAGGRYEWIGRMVRAAIVRPKVGVITLTDRVDRIATHPFWGVVLLLGVFAVVFWLTYTLALPIVNWLDAVIVQGAAEGLRAMLARSVPSWLMGLIADGVIGGVGTVLTFLPILAVFFVVLGVLEDVGYFARVAYVTDRFMHWMGLHGKSCLPMFLGFGCNVPGVMGSRIVEERHARLLTILLTPLVPCTGRWAVLTFLSPAFFGQDAALASWGLVALNLVVLAVAGVLLSHVIFRGARPAFIMEMPLYHLPNVRTIGLFVWYNIWAFVRKAGTIILVVSIAVWGLSMLPGGDVEHSVLAMLGRMLVPVGSLMGFGDWRLIVALLTSFVAKENTVATLGILFGAAAEGGLAEQVAAVLTPAAALAFLAVQMLFLPCVATIAVIRQETKGWRWVLYSIALQLLASLAVGTVIYQVGRLLL